ncbi:MAG: dihydrolipoyl dehydrogenase [Pseudomonadota bacterium]
MTLKIAIIGAGPGGYIAAARAAELGAKVTVVERDNVGGTCLNWGCIPSKIMKNTAELLERLRNGGEFGLTGGQGAEIDLAALAARKKAVVNGQAEEIMKLFQKHKIAYLRGDGAIVGPGLLEARPAGGGIEKVEWDRLIIAVGSSPKPLGGRPFDGERILSSSHALSLEKIPRSMLIVGAGVIGCEFAFIFSSFGCEVTLVEALGRVLPLPSVDEDISKVLGRELKKNKIKFLSGRVVEKIEERGGLMEATLAPSPLVPPPRKKDPQPLVAAAEKILVCIGRVPNTAGLGLESLGVGLDRQGWIEVDDFFRTNVPGVFAIGDILGPEKIMLAHVAAAEGRAAAQNALGGSTTVDHSVVPNVIFTSPEAAGAGLTEAQAREKGLDVDAETVHFRTIGKAQVIGEIAGQAKLVWERPGGRILGVHLAGPHASDLIAEGVLAVKRGVTIGELAETIHAHPTLAEIMGEVALAAAKRAG